MSVEEKRYEKIETRKDKRETRRENYDNLCIKK